MATAVKPTEKGQDARLEQIADLKKSRADLSDLVGLKNSPEWGKLVNLLKRYTEYAKREEKRANLDHDRDETTAEQFSKQVARFRQKQADFEFIVDVIENTEEKVELIEAEIKRVEKAYKDAKEILS
jgi:hypothetical protein